MGLSMRVIPLTTYQNMQQQILGIPAMQQQILELQEHIDGLIAGTCQALSQKMH